MLAGFYSSAVLLRFEYPMMIVTKTKQVFLKRLKRNKKMLTEQGSSDESKSNSLSRSIQLHTNTFLDSVNSSQLSKRTAELRDQLFPEFREKKIDDKSYDLSIHDIHNPSPNYDKSIGNKRQSILSQQSFADKLFKLSKNISLNQMIDSEAVQVNLMPNQTDISFLICDFDEIDKQQTIKNYEKLKSRDKQNFNHFQNPNQQEDYSAQRFKKKSKMFVTPFDQNSGYSNHEKTLQNPKSRRLPRQMQFSAMQRELKTRPIYPLQNRPGNPKMSAFYQTKNSLFIDGEENQHQQSYKTLERFRTSNAQKANELELKHIYNNRQVYGNNRAKASSYHQNHLPRTRSNNVFNIKRQPEDYNDYDHIVQKPKVYKPYAQESQSFTRREKYMQTGAGQYNQRHVNGQEMNERYSNKNRQNRVQDRYVTEFDLNEQNQRGNSPRFAHVNNDQQSEQQKFSVYSKHSSKMQGESKTPYLALHTQKYYPSSGYLQPGISNNFRLSEDTYSISYHQQAQPVMVHHQNLDDKLQKKKKIREKAAQLLSRVKSHEYLTARNQMPYSKRY